MRHSIKKMALAMTLLVVMVAGTAPTAAFAQPGAPEPNDEEEHSGLVQELRHPWLKWWELYDPPEMPAPEPGPIPSPSSCNQVNGTSANDDLAGINGCDD